MGKKALQVTKQMQVDFMPIDRLQSLCSNSNHTKPLQKSYNMCIEYVVKIGIKTVFHLNS